MNWQEAAQKIRMTRTTLYLPVLLAVLAIMSACTPPQPLDEIVSFHTISCQNKKGNWSANSSEYKSEAVETVQYRLSVANQQVIRGPSRTLRKYSDCMIFDGSNFYCLQGEDRHAIFNVEDGHLRPMCENESQCTSELTRPEFYRLKLLSYFDTHALNSYCESKAHIFRPFQIILGAEKKGNVRN